ncbi:galactoside alpha-(1,2)-fucosyltransferase 2-like [Oratosquilla oratoria]|uniref:galactoside alpha-(1,2)-fucosyltransferase 2-like n=1 Tax=Oratosquilla oratoria TaxID=337810 RepID=UPI003F770783
MNQTILGIDKSKYDFLINGTVNCSKPWVSITNDGRLGNKMCSLYHVYHIKYTYGMQAGLRPDMWESLRNIFPHLSLKLLPKECLHQMNKLKAIHHRDAFPLLEREGGTRNVLIGGMPCNMAKLWYLREVFIDEFRFSTSIIEKAQKRLASLLDTWRKRMLTHLPSNTQLSDDVTVVGVHARRTDYKRYLKNKYKGKVLSKHYFKVAFARARQMFGLTAFVVMSDDLTWCKENLMDEHGDVVVPTSNDLPQVDMALLSLCDHVIVSVGTYSTSGGLLSGGKFFYPVRDFSKNETVYGLQSRSGISKLTDVVPVWYDHTKE